MIIKKQELTTKTGLHFILRSPEESDAEDLLEYLKITAGETPYLMREPEEVTMTLEQEKIFLQKAAEAQRELLLIAQVDGKHAGNCSLMPLGSFKRYAHRCSVAIALYQKYCGNGIGRAMLEALLKSAEDLGYEQAELEVVTTNEPAVHLYKSLGFEVCGTLPRNMKYQDGSYGDVYWMVKRLV